jgi:hypothetical protein
MSASYVATLATSIDAATVQLRMVGTLADYTAAKLEAIKSDLAQMLRISPYMFRLSVEAALPPATGVDVSATMPDAAAADFMAKYAREQLSTLGSTQVPTEPDISIRSCRELGSRVLRAALALVLRVVWSFR